MRADAAGIPGSVPRVLHLSSRRIAPRLLGDDASFKRRLEWLTEEIGDQLAAALRPPAGAQPLSLICTTTLSKMVTGWTRNARALLDRIEVRTGVRPAGVLEGYQCAGWGYAVRFVATQTNRRWLLLSIVDADLHDFMLRGYEDVIGAIGFGITTVSLDLTDGTRPSLCAGPAPNHGFTDLLHAVRAQHKRIGPLPTFMPFLPEGLAAIAKRVLGDSLGPNRHDCYGHTFGSDPWIGLAEWLQTHRPPGERQVTLGAFAYDGYYTTGSVSVGPWTRVDLHEDSVVEAAR